MLMKWGSQKRKKKNVISLVSEMCRKEDGAVSERHVQFTSAELCEREPTGAEKKKERKKREVTPVRSKHALRMLISVLTRHILVRKRRYKVS